MELDFLTDEERAGLEKLTAADVEGWIQAQDGELRRVMRNTRSRMQAAHAILDRKIAEEFRALKAARPADFPAEQIIGAKE